VIIGRVDEMRNGKVYGWAYNSDNPGEHLEVSVNRGAEILATGLADRMREDLPEAGVGKGDHAFEIVLPPNISSFHGIMLVARSDLAGAAPLPIATNDERRIDDLFQIFSLRYDEALIALKSEIDVLKNVDEQASGQGSASLLEFERRLSELEKRIEDFEVFIVRLDEMSRILQERAGLTRSRGIFSFLFRRKK
jgi:hypothetical protein